MLSNETSKSTQKHHRTNSTPLACHTTARTFITPAKLSHQHGLHRRGLTIDESIYSQTRPNYTQKTETVSTNYGSQGHQNAGTQQHDLARPGQQNISITNNINDGNNHNLFSTPHITFEDDPFGTTVQQPSQFFEHYDQDVFSENFKGTIFDTSTTISQPASSRYLNDFDNKFVNGDESISNEDIEELKRVLGIDDASTNEPNHPLVHGLPRPFTPPNTQLTDFLYLGAPPSNKSARVESVQAPMTPPRSQESKTQRKQYSRTAQSSPVRHGAINRIEAPSGQPMKRGRSCQDPFTTPKKLNGTRSFPSPPNTVPLLCTSTFDIAPIPAPSFMSMSALDINFARNNGYESSHPSPMSSRLSPELSSFHSSPELAKADLFADLGIDISQDRQQEAFDDAVMFEEVTSPVREEAPSRKLSSSDNLFEPQMDALIQDTGITSEEIASFIDGPDSEGKYQCRYPECDKRFGRKENIRAHVQTHLGDRQFLCKDCDKRFVRQHDLKRHSKIHSGEKQYICGCNTKFARHDALTRHRQRGCCIGAFPNTPKRESKRGRPRKGTRPDTPERREKAARTRQRVLEKKAYASSQSGSSEYSIPSPPETLHDINMRSSSPFSLPMEPPSYEVSPDIFSFTPPTSPYSTGVPPVKEASFFDDPFTMATWSDDYYVSGRNNPWDEELGI